MAIKIYKYRQNTTIFIILYHFWTTCFDSFVVFWRYLYIFIVFSNTSGCLALSSYGWAHRITELGHLSATISDIKSLRAGDNRWRNHWHQLLSLHPSAMPQKPTNWPTQKKTKLPGKQLLWVVNNTPWQVGRPGWKLGVLDRHLLTRVSWHFAFLTTDGKSAVNNVVVSSQPITDLYS